MRSPRALTRAAAGAPLPLKVCGPTYGVASITPRYVGRTQGGVKPIRVKKEIETQERKNTSLENLTNVDGLSRDVLASSRVP